MTRQRRVAALTYFAVLGLVACDSASTDSSLPTSRELAVKLRDAGHCRSTHKVNRVESEFLGVSRVYRCGKATVWAARSARQLTRVVADSRHSVQVLCNEGGAGFDGLYIATGRYRLAGNEVGQLRRPAERLAEALRGKLRLLVCE